METKHSLNEAEADSEPASAASLRRSSHSSPGKSNMVPSIIILACVALVLAAIAVRRSPESLGMGVASAWTQFLQAFPIVVLTFIVLGLLAVVVPRDVYVRWLSAEAGWRGIFVGTLAGMAAPGGPVIQTIIASALFKAGAGLGCIVAFLTAGALAHLLLLPLELGLLGWRFVCARLACTLFFPPVAGILAHTLFRTFVR